MFVLFAALGGMWAAGLIAADTSNKLVAAAAGLTGVTGYLVAGYSHIEDAVSLVFSGESTGWGMTAFVIGLILLATVWLMNTIFTSNHEPIL